MAATDSITQARLKELLHYSPETGLFVWLVDRRGTAKKGAVAGGHDKYGYIQIGIDGMIYRAHRLVFLYVLGWMPEQVDHDDQVKDNNRWKNLYPADHQINMKNRCKQKNNSSGITGISWHNIANKWRVSINAGGKRIYLGLFTEISDAKLARKEAELRYGYHLNHGA